MKALLFCLMFLVTCSNSFGCVCHSNDNVFKYCQGTFAMKVQIMSEMIQPDGAPYAFYRINTKTVYKPDNMNATDRNKLYTRTGTCMARLLENRRTYLIAGLLQEDTPQKLTVSYCSLMEPFRRRTGDKVKKYQRQCFLYENETRMARRMEEYAHPEEYLPSMTSK